MKPGKMRISFGLLLLVAATAGGLAAPADEPKPPPAPPERFAREQREHWAYQPPKRPALPPVEERSWTRNPIDSFILSALEEMEFRHAPEADRLTLLRRVTFDLTGLPPTPELVAEFLSDSRPDAYERLIDRLLASPAYGQRWAQHWLDLAHYADSNGFELDAERPDAWRYRDWVVDALNRDMPYDRFLMLQLAGDECEPGSEAALIATGFGRSGPREVVGGNIDPLVKRQSELTEVTGTVGSVFLGLTLACARCHDHKFDALPTTDYYRLQAFFAAAEFVELPISSEAERAEYATARKAVEAQVAPFRQRMSAIEAPYRERLLAQKKAMLTSNERAVMAIDPKKRTPAQKRLAEGLATTLKVSWEEVAEEVAKNPVDHAERESLKRRIDQVERTLPRPPAHAQALVDRKAKAPDTYVYRRGDTRTLGPRVEPRPPGVILATLPADAFEPTAIVAGTSTTGRRQALARWLVRPDHPLTARVLVNRLWQHHFGRGIVATPSDFGVRGEPPSHPELLDWLATELIAQGWSLKAIHRLMVTSATYRQASRVASDVAARQSNDDPDNTLLWHMNRRRLDAESLRDSMLTVTGELNPRAGGPGVMVPIEKEIEDLIFTEAEVVDLWPETPDASEHLRRSLYLFRKRNVRYPMFDAFDAPDTQSACPQRAVSTHALQALVLLNSDFAVARARGLVDTVCREATTDASRLDRMYQRVLGRSPRPAEVERSLAFLATQSDLLRESGTKPQRGSRPSDLARLEPSRRAAWADLALALLNCNEFVYVP